MYIYMYIHIDDESVTQAKTSSDKKEINSSTWGVDYGVYRYFSLCYQ